eukprot:5195967-Pyramimonas_sp.AAC.1
MSLAFSHFSLRLSRSSRGSPLALAAILEAGHALYDRLDNVSDPSWAAWPPFWRLLGQSCARPGVPRGASEAPERSGTVPFCLAVSLF